MFRKLAPLFLGLLTFPPLHADRAPKVIGYLPEYRLADNAFANVSKCSDVVYFGSEISEDGTIKMADSNPKGLKKLQESCKEHKVDLHLCLGGWKKDTHYAKVCADPKLRAKVIASLKALQKKYGFQGVDYDWEYPRTDAEMAGFILLCKETHEQMGKDFLVTAAFHPGHDIPQGLADQLDRIHLMTYDLANPHCSIDHSHAAIKKWTTQGIAPEKLCIGIASYARNEENRSDVKTYQQLIQEHGKTSHTTMPVNGYFGDNQQSAHQKLQLAQKEKLGGVIIWELGQSPAGENSILHKFPSNKAQ